MDGNVCYIIVLNYEGSDDTIQCLKSLEFTKNDNCKIIIVDNASKDLSVKKIDEWCRKNIREDYSGVLNKETMEDTKINKWVTLCTSDVNNGFAAGNNIGINLAIRQNDCQSLFILNNDTEVYKDVIKIFRKNMNEYPEAGIFSLKLVNYADRNVVQFNNQMKFCKILARITASDPDIKCKKEPDFYSGAAFFVTKKFIDNVGLMDERYFLFYEELDWVMAAKRNNFKIRYMDDAIVAHKCSATTGKNTAFSQFCYTRSSLLFTRKYYSVWLVTVVLFSIIRAAYKWCNHDFENAKNIIFAVYVYFKYRGRHVNIYRLYMD